MQPRTQHYQMAHRLLRDDVHRHAAQTWSILMGPDANDYLAMQWATADVMGESLPPAGLGVVGLRQQGGWELLAVAMPAPQAPTEAHWVILVRRPNMPHDVGYFVAEQGVTTAGETPLAYVAEWRRDGSRIRMADLPAVTPDAFADAVAAEVVMRPMPAFGPVPLAQVSMAPTAVPPRVPPKGHGGKIAAAIAAALVLSAGAWMVKREADKRAFVAAFEKEQAALDAARDGAGEAEETARERVEAWKEHRRQCVVAERERASKAVAAADYDRLGPKRPRDGGALEGALPVRVTDGQTRPITATWMPTHTWLGGGTSCDPLPEGVSVVEKTLEDPPSKYGRGDRYLRELEDHMRQLNEGVEALGTPPSEPTASDRPIVVVEERCSARTIAQFSGLTGRMSLDRSTCRPRLVWLDAGGEVLAVAVGVGAANPTDPGMHTNDAELRRFNRAARAAALREAGAKVGMLLDRWD